MQAVVADADAGRAELLRTELDRQGHEVHVARDAGEVLGAAILPRSLVVLGWRVGEDDAPAVCRGLRARAGDDEPVIVIVGSPSEVDVEAAVAAGATDVWILDAGRTPDALGTRLELARHFARLQAENLRVGGEFALMRQALDLSGTGFVLTDPRLDDDPIVYANRSFFEITGYGESEVLGRNCRMLQGPSTDPADVERVRRALRAGLPVEVELVNHRKDGTPFFNALHIAAVRDGNGRVVRHLGVQVDVTAYRVREQLFAVEQKARIAAEAAERRSSFLAAASPTLDSQLDLRATLESLARLSVPYLADVCLVEAVDAGQVRRVAASADDPRLERALLALPLVRPFEPKAQSALARVLRTGRPEILQAADGEDFDLAVHELLADDGPSGVAPRWMVLPLRARGHVIGVVALAGLTADRVFGVEELALAQDLAGRAALALDNARLYEQQVEVAQVLQQSFLPERIPDVEGLSFAARYRPADGPAEIGGDFYDLVPLGDGAVALAVGDVTGKGAAAAALTGLCRHTLRTAWVYEERPERVLATLNAALLAQRARQGRYATVLLATLTPGPEGVTAEVVLAGHPAPRVLRADGTVEVLGQNGTILGWREELELRPVTGLLAPGDALVLYTDGVSSGDDGGPLTARRLAAELERGRGLAPEALASALERAALDAQVGRPPDDVAIVVARATPTA